MNFQMFKLVLEKAEEPEIKLPTSAGSSKKQEFQENMYFCFIDYAKAFDCVDHYMLCYAKSFQSCLTLCDLIDSSPPGSPVPGILQARTLEWVAISFSDA